MINPVSQLKVLLYEYLMFESHRRHERYYQRLDDFYRRLHFSKPEKAFLNEDFLELIELYVSYATFEEISKDLYNLIRTFGYLDEDGSIKR